FQKPILSAHFQCVLIRKQPTIIFNIFLPFQIPLLGGAYCAIYESFSIICRKDVLHCRKEIFNKTVLLVYIALAGCFTNGHGTSLELYYAKGYSVYVNYNIRSFAAVATCILIVYGNLLSNCKVIFF